jgi:asparagine synthase (glutamine-hydrolysing)
MKKMCRIAGIINPSLPITETAALVKEMCRILQHGGPDDEVFIVVNPTRSIREPKLSLIDLSSGGHQPMSYAEGGIGSLITVNYIIILN